MLTNQSQTYAVYLQMIAGGLLALKVKDATKVGTDKLKGAHLCVVCPNATFRRDQSTYLHTQYNSNNNKQLQQQLHHYRLI